MGLPARAHGGLVRARRLRAVTRIRAAARLAGAALDLDVADDAVLGDLDVRFAGPGRAVLHIGAHTVLDDGVEIRLSGGSVRIGEWCEVRSGVRIMVGGELEVRGQNLLSWGMVVHCNEAIVLDRQSTFGEYVTISDSAHEHVEDGWHLDQLRTAPVRVGADTWVGAKATITRGVTVGDRCTVAGSAVVTRDVPDDHLAAGIPAVARPLAR
jgi:acetyltransferase-like isoleucine patch superfamily enzyme